MAFEARLVQSDGASPWDMAVRVGVVIDRIDRQQKPRG